MTNEDIGETGLQISGVSTVVKTIAILPTEISLLHLDKGRVGGTYVVFRVDTVVCVRLCNKISIGQELLRKLRHSLPPLCFKAK